ncbi:ribosome recycling factor [Buchnera aphidicola (Thelaxes californica)]|uniref:Ribosome-recycling factor n=1 Tax=Buchnera aphidicola (Thelaxes californica) TaxID=1315998 RepID=A0A4D6YJM6_9GAMM|nr:ribosome recycling factor [Buchnera aphidicola]QCI26721.1 ribosome recycling factor [Buchnera aphidicola (Thelaxes californica)]
MINNIIQNTKDCMEKHILVFKNHINTIRTNRVCPEILNNIYIEYYGKKIPLCQVSSIVSSDARTLKVSPFNNEYFNFIKKTIINLNLGFSLNIRENNIYVTVPDLTEENRKKLVKIVKNDAEKVRIYVRNTRRDNNELAKKALKEKNITKDEERKIQNEIQKITNLYIQKIDHLVSDKETDLMTF